MPTTRPEYRAQGGEPPASEVLASGGQGNGQPEGRGGRGAGTVGVHLGPVQGIPGFRGRLTFTFLSQESRDPGIDRRGCGEPSAASGAGN